MLTKEEMPACPVATTVQLIGSKWKLLILRNLLARPWRFNELRKSLEGISQKVLTDSLRSMEEDGLVTHTVYPEVPPRVEYSLSPLGNPCGPSSKPWSSGVLTTRPLRPGNSRALQQKRSRRLETAGGFRFLHSILFTFSKGAGILNPPGKSPARIPSPPAQG